jgi:hypothetical protein
LAASYTASFTPLGDDGGSTWALGWESAVGGGDAATRLG